ncbi:hypothetical protein EYR40_001338 [Pleurotus pulmonarius]|nr:hypothetical protein EYR38_004577 [Pleurotus pulmonarius]KAF4608985.1 hypothetical protein EYR40_001338 [Pleurotus pulmonarius]
MSSETHNERKRGRPRRYTTQYGIEHFLRERDDKKDRSLVCKVNRIIRDTFDWKHYTAKKQPESNWNKFWTTIKRVHPNLLDKEMETAVVNQVQNHINNARRTRRRDVQLKINNTSNTTIHSHSLSDVKLSNTTIVILDKDLPRFRRPATCLLPLPLPAESQVYEVSIIPIPAQTTSWKHQTSSVHQASFTFGQTQPSEAKFIPTPPARLAARTHQPKFFYRLPSLATGPAWESPDVHKFLSECVPSMTYLLSKFVNDLEIRDLKCLLTLKRWPPRTLQQYFRNLTRRKKLTGMLRTPPTLKTRGADRDWQQDGAWKSKEQAEEARYVHEKEQAQLAAIRDELSKNKEDSTTKVNHDFEGGFGGQEDLEDRYATTSGEH